MLDKRSITIFTFSPYTSENPLYIWRKNWFVTVLEFEYRCNYSFWCYKIITLLQIMIAEKISICNTGKHSINHVRCYTYKGSINYYFFIDQFRIFGLCSHLILGGWKRERIPPSNYCLAVNDSVIPPKRGFGWTFLKKIIYKVSK